MKICSLVPSATEILYELGLEGEVVGVTDICDYPASTKDKRVVCRSLFDPATLTSAEVEGLMKSTLKSLGSPFVLDVSWFHETRPDLIIAQDLCYACSPDASKVVNICKMSGASSNVLILHPKTLSGILESILQIGRATGSEKGAEKLRKKLANRIKAVSSKVSTATCKPRALSIEGVNPLVLGGNWLPEMRIVAGGRDEPFAPGSPAQRVSWELVRAAAPEVLVIALCSSPIARSIREAEWLTRQEGWSDLPAVRNGRVHVVEHVYFSRPGPRIVTGLEILAELLQPELFEGMIPEGAARSFHSDKIPVS